ncbi:MAG: lamin tail domain-containing protein [Anaerolineae bacterium]|nr:lamin tail domain-containing protein [Anaerolineae bacterium]
MKRFTLCALLAALTLSACTATPGVTPTATPVMPTATQVAATATPAPEPPPASLPGRIVFSELIPGIPGNNNFEFIELYNAGTEAVDLKGWSLWYKMTDDKEAQRVAIWTARTDVPGYGHYLLARAGVDVGVPADRVFDTPLFERKGGLVLKNAAGEVADTLGWGDAPTAFIAGVPALTPADGASIERVPGGPAGNHGDTDNGIIDFFIQYTPNPQNRGATITPLPEKRLEFTARALPVKVKPGAEFIVEISAANLTGAELGPGILALPIPEGFAVISAPPEATLVENVIEVPFSQLPTTMPSQWMLTLRSPWSYGTVFFGGAYIESQDWPMRAYAPLAGLSVEGGAVPIGAARTLVGSTVTVEGVAAMYTGGFYAGSTGTKFYIQDETGGVQVYCPGGAGAISVRVGDRVRVTGEIQVYRDSIELVPATYPDDVLLLEKVEPPTPQKVTGEAANGDTSLPGRLIEVEGTLTRLEEFSYSYEADLLDAQGDLVYVYIDKETRINPEFLEVGKQYRIAGISEFYNTKWELEPRTSADFVEVFPPELMIEVQAQNSAMPGAVITYTLTAFNHTAAPLTGVRIVAAPPEAGATVGEVLDGGVQETDGQFPGRITWEIAELAGDGGSAVVRFTATVDAGTTEPVLLPPAGATANEWPEPALSESWRTFAGSGVPVWAIQGDGNSSPFVRNVATTEGLVTGVFPKQGGFWIQSPEPDDDPATSEGLFVLVATDIVSAPAVALGDRVRLTGKVREVSGQTLLYLEDGAALTTLSSDNALPDAVELDPPQEKADARTYYEALEGMLVAVTEPALVIAPTTKYGETALVRPSWEISRVMKNDPQGMVIFVDDGSNETHADRSTMPFALKSGDQIADVLGPLAFTYENYKIQPIVTPTLLTAAVSLPTLAPAGIDEFSIATFNAENFFDVVDPHPADPPKPMLDEYQRKLTKVARTVVAMGAPTIIGLEEIENIGVLEDIAAQEELLDYGYVPVLIEGFDSRGIDVGFLVRGDLATLDGASQHNAPEGLTSRPPLLITVTVHLASGDQTVNVISNHFTAMSGGEASTEPQRTAQAEWNVTLVQMLLAENPEAWVAVLGDLNSFYTSRPMDAMRAGGLRHVYEFLATDREPLYTYIYQGESETLDHIWVTPPLFEHIRRVEVLHVNSDYPPAAPDDDSPEHTSDHDPLVVTFTVQ